MVLGGCFHFKNQTIVNGVMKFNWGEGESPTKFSKRGSLTGSQFLEVGRGRGCWGRGG